MNCLYCNGELRSEPWNALTCLGCGSVMVQSPPTEEDLIKYYDNYLDAYHGGGAKVKSSSRQINWAKAYLRAVTKFAKKSGRLIDIGSANNPFPNIATASGYDVSVLDFNKPPSLDEKVSFLPGSLNEDVELYKKLHSKFDIVTSWAVLEHCLYTKRAIEIMTALCKPGGCILISTPEIGTVSEKYGAGRTPWFYPPEHIYLISRKALRLMFEEMGCEYIYAGKLEYSSLRWVLRYSLTWIEGILGMALRVLAPSKWAHLRYTRKTKAAGVTLAVFRKL